jgi:RimJ/RimL family protein N-acetyltransferase
VNTAVPITLRFPVYEDLAELYAAVQESLPELSRWLAWCTPAYSLNDASDWLNSRRSFWEQAMEYDFIITDARTDELLGVCGLNGMNQQNNFANLGYWVRTSKTRCGIASSAVQQLALFGFEQVKLGRIEIIAASGNLASQRVAEKAGATREGLLRCRNVVHKNVYDAVMFSLTANDVEKLRAATHYASAPAA